MTDPIADMLTRIRNAQMVKKSEVVLPYSKLKLNLLEILKREGWIGSLEKNEPAESKTAKSKINKTKASLAARFATLTVGLKYDSGKSPKISSLRRLSKPGRRVYVSKDEIPTVLSGKGLAVLSTSAGLMTGKEARARHVGGELICEIY